MRWNKNIMFILIFISALALVTVARAEENHHADYTDMSIADCNDCHREEGVTANHQAGWNADHRLAATRGESNCAVCHKQSFCLDCHKGGGIGRDLDVSSYRSNYVPKSHRTGFREIHPISAASDPAKCNRCHDKQFCSDCHDDFRPEDLQFLSHRRGWSDIEATSGGPKHSTFSVNQCQTCHPGSVLPRNVWAQQHAREARQNLSSCEACHPEANVCLKCHSAKTGLKINPHPSNWNDVKEKYGGATDNKTCRRCH